MKRGIVLADDDELARWGGGVLLAYWLLGDGEEYPRYPTSFISNFGCVCTMFSFRFFSVTNF